MIGVFPWETNGLAFTPRNGQCKHPIISGVHYLAKSLVNFCFFPFFSAISLDLPVFFISAVLWISDFGLRPSARIFYGFW